MAYSWDALRARDRRHWKEFYLRAHFLRPKGTLIQVLRTDKAAIQSETPEFKTWPGFDPAFASHPQPVGLVGLRVATRDIAATERSERTGWHGLAMKAAGPPSRTDLRLQVD